MNFSKVEVKVKVKKQIKMDFSNKLDIELSDAILFFNQNLSRP